VAETFAGKAKAAQLALVGGAVGAAWAPGGVVRVAFAFRVADGKVRELSVVADGEQLGALAPVVLS
jgi:RNA polymerase sigma-70 factor (ECF subfamily)